MSEMIERVGRALAAGIITDNVGSPGAYKLDYPWLCPTGAEGSAINMDVAARAAIEAMRRPLSKQLGEAAAAHGGDRVFWSSLLGDIISDALSTPNTDKA